MPTTPRRFIRSRIRAVSPLRNMESEGMRTLTKCLLPTLVECCGGTEVASIVAGDVEIFLFFIQSRDIVAGGAARLRTLDTECATEEMQTLAATRGAVERELVHEIDVCASAL